MRGAIGVAIGHCKRPLFHILLVFLLPPQLGSSQEFLQDGALRLAYWTVTSPIQDRLIVVVHGGPGIAHGYLRPEMDRYSKWGEVIYYDQRGCGASGGIEEYGWRDHIADLRRIVTTLAHDRQVVLVGSSFGALIIAQYVARHPEGIAGLIVSGLESVGSPIPHELQSRLIVCAATARATREGFHEVFWSGDELFRVPHLLFTDTGPRGTEDTTGLVSAGGRGRTIFLPTHNPWYTHSQTYFSTVAEFMDLLDSPGDGR